LSVTQPYLYNPIYIIIYSLITLRPAILKIVKLPVLPNLGYNIDEKYWCRNFKPNREKFYQEGIINRYITFITTYYRENRITNKILFNEFQIDFVD
jgi:hypothetical protein